MDHNDECSCIYCETEPSTAITVIYTRHGHRDVQTGWSCCADAELFAAWLIDVGAAIDVEVVEL